MEIDSLFTLIEYPLSDEDRAVITRAYEFAKTKHEGQKRNSGEPYFMHVFEVSKNCALLGMDVETIAAALLHDTLEDTVTTEEEMTEHFGERITFLVKGVTKLGKLKYRGQQRHVESLRKFFVAMAEDLRVLIIKLADRLHNVSTLEHVRPEKQKRIALETIEVHAALAGRLGMEKLKGMLEDYAFPFAYPKEYATTKKIMDEIVPETRAVVEFAHKEIDKVLKEFNISNATISSRVKHTYSTYKKLARYKMNAEQVYDIVALRVVTESVADCYQVLGLVHMLWKPLPKRIKDYIALPKPNGYQSLHTTVITEHGIVEIQIRTQQMHQEAELGVASHFLYKETNTAPSVPKKKLTWLDELKELHTVVQNPSRFLEQLRVDFFKNRIFVFSPKGDVIDLPEHASPIDFAFAIHSAIGTQTSSARINGKMAPLGAELHNGDIVEIITSKNSKPSSKWLDYAKTSGARKKIRAYIHEHGGLLEKFLVKKE
jgi:GTP diphosphokinase / guanosine-3',5'-bis(diphosphate) 3'-diphosphatase